MQPTILTISDHQIECALHENHPLRLTNARGRRMECVEGVLWITAYGGLDDIFLHPGDVFVIPHDRLVLAEGVGHGRARIFMQAPMRSVIGRLLQGWKAGMKTLVRSIQRLPVTLQRHAAHHEHEQRQRP
ncbi:DUF2917 domain-containing protein [Noviherbaspirillum cavernae]|uniref:DUF2917 domain-containing protein n=1 Tax=Noviherbaspirillum cavernae TaxID=2320862 RepID=A0A418X597_9BURK|nr:DUF2917 domain-containing protein [Noviherbaspirillum cavernae]RJG07589.1 DUF2917 domain-containing protein [Noviherbaspirillum cavernae]